MRLSSWSFLLQPVIRRPAKAARRSKNLFIVLNSCVIVGYKGNNYFVNFVIVVGGVRRCCHHQVSTKHCPPEGVRTVTGRVDDPKGGQIIARRTYSTGYQGASGGS